MQLHVVTTHYRVTRLVEILEKTKTEFDMREVKETVRCTFVILIYLYFLIPGLCKKKIELLSVLLLHVCFTESEHCYQV